MAGLTKEQQKVWDRLNDPGYDNDRYMGIFMGTEPPASPAIGAFYFDTNAGNMFTYVGKQLGWVEMGE